jgi:hypothetical protein
MTNDARRVLTFWQWAGLALLALAWAVRHGWRDA